MLTFAAPIPEERVPLELTPEAAKCIKGAVKEAQMALGTLVYFLEHADGPALTRALSRDALNLTESQVAKLGEWLGVDTEAAQRIEERHGEIRAANLRIRELEKELGQSMSPVAIQPALKALCERLNSWWEREGFGLVSSIQFGEYNVAVEFSCGFYGSRPYVPGAEGKSHKERKALWLADLQRRGFVLNEDDGKGVTDCAQSREALRALFAERFPGKHKIAEFVSHEGRHCSVLRSVKVRLHALPQILDLPELPAAEEIDVDA